MIENTLTAEEVGAALEAMQRLRTELIAAQAQASSEQLSGSIVPPAGGAVKVRGCWMTDYEAAPHNQHFMHITEADPAIFSYLTHPRLIAMAEELVGGPVRLEEAEAAVNRRDPAHPVPGAVPGFHAGGYAEMDSFQRHGLTHCSFVKTLTNLTPLGPEDGGTAVIPGVSTRAGTRSICLPRWHGPQLWLVATQSHKLNADVERQDIIEAALASPDTLTTQVLAPAGSTLLFGETLIHG